MTERIFENFAPAYWSAGLPVIPLRQRNKMPAINAWSTYCTRMPDVTEQAHWLHSFPKGNIGLPLGASSGLCVVDIDTEDEALIAAIREICGPSPWVRIGKKGMALAYKWEQQRNFKLRGADGGMLCEFLGQGNQLVVPPSIHPDTQKRYVANANLWEVLEDIPYLGEDIEEKLRALLGAKGYELGAGGRSSPLDVIPAGERDVQMVRHAGYLARVVLGIDRSANFALYEAIVHMHTWVEQFTAKVSGDAMDPNKGVAKLLEFLVRDLEKGRTMPEGWDAGLPDAWREHPTIQMMFEKNASQRWTLVRAREWFGAKLAENANDDDWILARMGEILALVSADDQFRQHDLRALIAYIQSTVGRKLGLTKSDLTAIYKEATRGGDDDELESHAAIGRQVLEEMQLFGEIRYDQGQFWQWNGSCFVTLEERTILLHVADNVDSPLSRRNHDYKAIVSFISNLCSRPNADVGASGVNFSNGFVGVDLQRVDHDPKFGATFTLPFPYEAGFANECTLWFEFLAACWGDEPDFADRVLALQEMFAATLFGMAPRYQMAFLLFGRSSTGKTQVLNVLRALLPPDAAASLGPQHWDERFALTQLIGKTANIVGELPENGLITGSVFKEVVEGSPISTEYKGKDRFSFTPKAAHWFASNYLPRSHDTTDGFARRWMILDFKRRIDDREKIDNFAEVIVAAEREAIAAWALAGLPRLIAQKGYTSPACHRDQVRRMRRSINSVFAFLEDGKGLQFGQGTMKCRDLYDMYCFHVREVARVKPVEFEPFMQMVADLGHDTQQDIVGEYMVIGISKGATLRAVA